MFVALCSLDDQTPLALEQGEVQPSDVLLIESEEIIGTLEIPVSRQSPCVDSILQENHKSPSRLSSSPSYAKVLKEKLVDSSGSSDEDSIEQSSKKVGRKSRKEIREEEAVRLKMQGCQATIEMSLGRSKKNIPQKGGATPSCVAK